MFIKMIYSLILFVLFGCASNASDVKPSKMVSDFFHMPISEQVKQFKNHSLDEQYELLIFGNQVVHPPATHLASSFAEQGPSIVPFLKNKLKAKQEEVTVRDIVLVFSRLAQLKLYDFSNDAELMGLLDRRVSDMHGIWKEPTREMISKIHSMH